MVVDQHIGNDVLNALQGANFPERLLYLVFAQSSHETNGFTDHKLTEFYNGSGIVFTGSAEQRATGAYDSGIKQPDGPYNYAGYPGLHSWAADHYRVLSRNDGHGAPIDAANLDEFVTRLKANGYFGDTYNRYRSALLAHYNSLVEQFPPEQHKQGLLATLKNIVIAKKSIILATLCIVAILTIIYHAINYMQSMKKAAIAALLTIFISFSAGAQTPGGLSPLPPCNTASYGMTQQSSWSTQLSILDSLFMLWSDGSNGMKVVSSGSGGGGDTCLNCSYLPYLYSIDTSNSNISRNTVNALARLTTISTNIGTLVTQSATANGLLGKIDTSNTHLSEKLSAVVANTNMLNGGEQHIGYVSPGTIVAATITPTVATAAYTAGYVLGGIMQFENVLRVNGGTAKVSHLMVIDGSYTRPTGTMYFFSQAPSGTYTDATAFTLSTSDYAKLTGMIVIPATANYVGSPTSTPTRSVADLPPLYSATGPLATPELTLRNTESTKIIYAVFVVSNTPTPLSTSDYTFKLFVNQF